MSSCSYQSFDPLTLTPVGDESIARISDLNKVWGRIVGKRVLDIGTNSGLVAITAVRSGAKHIEAVDVDTELIHQLQEISQKYSLPITASVCGFDRLCSEDHRSEVVFCFEVIHWLVHQGKSPEEIVSKLDEVTGLVLFVETPWDNTEKSIKARMNSHLENYSLPKFFELFMERGFTIEILGFATYFSDESRRVLMKLERK